MATSPQKQEQMSPQDAFRLLKEGNQRFTSQCLNKKDFEREIQETAGGQNPFAVVLGCMDSRVPSEIIFDLGMGDIFNVRVAGNVINNDVLGSLEYACKVVGAKLILVLGHTGCGAVKSACQNVKLGNITGILEKLKPVIKRVQQTGDKNKLTGQELENRVVVENVLFVVESIKQQSAIIQEQVNCGQVQIVGALYNVATGKVTFYDNP